LDTNKNATIEVRNALFAVADGKPVEAVIQGTIMAHAKLVANACDGNVTKTRAVLEQWHRVMMDAVPIYCAEIEAGCPHPAKH
jgi:hypothetical protein